MSTILLILIAIGIAAAIYFFLKKATFLVVNAVLGILALFLINWFDLLAAVGAPDIEINLATLLICAFGGLPGAILLVLLHLVGIHI